MSEKDKQNQLEDVIVQHERALKLALTVVDKMGSLTKGQDVEVDNKLTQLRKTTGKGVELSTLTSRLTETHESIKSLENQHYLKQKALRDFLLEAGETLQSVKGMEENVRRKLRMVVNKVKSKETLLFNELQPTVANLVETYRLVALQFQQKPVENQSKDQQLNPKLLKNIIVRLDKLSQNAIIKPRLNEFKKRIDVSTHDFDRLEICLTYFEESVTQFSEEFLQTQKLILNVNAALADVHKTLIKSINCSKDYGNQLEQLNRKIDGQIDELSKNADSANSVSNLKQIIENKLNVITESIKQRDKLEKQRAADLDNVLQDMESKLANLEQRTEFYRKKWLEEIARADLDALTNLPNRGAYDKRFNEEFKRWLRHPDPLCIAVIDVDHFKKINDKYGHSVGDKTLQIVAKTLRTSLRETDFLARYGGEEFVCLMINTDATNMLTPLEKLRKAVSSIPFKVKNDRLNITVSVGVTMLVATDNVHTAFDRADKALYEAKDAGRNRICYKK
ncbi:diguanylate cyclase [Psychrosphaera sp. 1_MG-2023]|uniref:GGDEF domain-containing protein n=1 Tax=Psychrosphaera sp. 1_MG-2023 TaxID=3062643 RepID=UPI0026E1D416|nr:GGDEF domain-containing protein [Psychrosphaera sp. 1_MG-2023]MDO6718047.1 diguanylate cyclase [Psychrosphaera sp. 1_MG-2023]